MQCLLDVIGRTAAELAIARLHFPDLSERRLDECRCAVDERHDPHPEHGTRAADCDGGCHTSDVARAHAGSRRDHHGLERRHALATFDVLLLGDGLEHVLQMRELHTLGANREVQTCCNEQEHQEVGVHVGIDGVCYSHQGIHIHIIPLVP